MNRVWKVREEGWQGEDRSMVCAAGHITKAILADNEAKVVFSSRADADLKGM